MKEIKLPEDKYLQAKKDTRITARANQEYQDKLKEMSVKFNLSEGVLLSYMIDYFYEEIYGEDKGGNKL